jgi:hypothetical protein
LFANAAALRNLETLVVTMKLNFFPILALLISLADAAVPVLKFVGDTSLYCPDATGNVVVRATDFSVNQEAIKQGIIPRGSTVYFTSLNGKADPVVPATRHLRSGDHRELANAFCTSNGCPSGNSITYCHVIGCYRRRRELAPAPATTTLTDAQACAVLVQTAKDSLAEHAAQQLLNNGPNSVTCAALFSTTEVSCEC